MDFDPVLLSRIQFAFTISFHIIFPAFTIGLASWLAMLEWRYLRTGNPVFKNIYMFWSKIFAVAFGMGVVSGIAMIYQFGTNWSEFSYATGNVLGPLMAYEALTAFFLEASFLGIMLFGWNRVGPRLHFFSTCMVAGGTLLSAFWILSANSWMQTPAGYEIRDGVFYATDWLEVIFNPSTPYRFAHMVLAAYLTTSCVVAGIASWYLWRGRAVEQARVMLTYAVFFIAIVAPTQLFVGDLHGLNVLEHQPVKVAAMEGQWETGGNAPLRLFALVDEENEMNRFEIKLPNMASLILTHSADGVVPGLKDWAPEDRPPVNWVFWSFRVMVAVGMWMIFAGLVGVFLRLRGRLYDTSWFHYVGMSLTPLGFVAVLAGWFVAEIGRQPYTVYGVLRTMESASPVPGSHVLVSLIVFAVAYFIIFGAGTYYIMHLIGKGPEHMQDDDGTPVLSGRPLNPEQPQQL